MKRVLIIGLSPILGGVETYIFNLIKNMDITAYSFDFLIIGQEKRSVFETDLNNILGNDRKHFYYCPNLKKNFIESKKWLHNFYRKNYYDLIYMNTCTAARVNYCKYALKRGTKLITHSHNGFGLSKINNLLYRRYVRIHSNRLLSCSDVAADWLFGVNAKNVQIIANGVDTERFRFSLEYRKEIRDRYHIDDSKIVIGHVGRFYEQKNHKYFLKLAQKLDNKYLFLCIGDGELKEDFIEWIKKLNIANRFILIPSQKDIEKYYSAMDIFVMPSLFEGLPIVAIEAQSTGLSCIFSDKISKQTDLSGHCVFLPLELQNLWIDTIREMDIIKYEGTNYIESKGFSIKSTAEEISKIFLQVLDN